MDYSLAQTFLIDPLAVANSSVVYLTGVDLFFKKQPAVKTNSSGINNPGVQLYITNVKNNIPDLTSVIADSYVRLQYSDISVSNNSSTMSSFMFDNPLPVASNKMYAILLKYEDPAYDIWTSVKGDRLVGTNNPSPGPSGKYTGDYFDYGNSGTITKKADTDLKFRVNIAKFNANSATYELVNKNYEFLTLNSSNGIFRGGERIFQDSNLKSPSGTLSVVMGNNSVTGIGTHFTTDFSNNDFFAVNSGGKKFIMQVQSISSNTFLQTAEVSPITNSAANYFKTVVAQVVSFNPLSNTVVLSSSSANNSVFFRSNTIDSLVINNGGTGYNNLDIIVISGGGSVVNATATVSTNSTGGIISYGFIYNGIGFTGTPTLTVANSAMTGSANGTGADISFNKGFTIRGEQSNSTANVISVDNFNIHRFKPELFLGIPTNSTANLSYNFSNNAYYVNNARYAGFLNQQLLDLTAYDGMIASKSNEVRNPSNLHDTKSGVFKIDLKVNLSSTNLYEAPFIYIKQADILAYQYLVNNDDTSENTRYGKALAKHITTKVDLANGMIAEDIVVYADVYQPSGTTVEAYAKIYNNQDTDAFDDKDWSPLILKDGINLYSSNNNPNDVIELTYGFPLFPPSTNTISGTASASLSNNTITGSGTSFTTQLTANSLIKIYQPLFPSNYMIASVASITNDTQIVLNEEVSNTGIAQSGLNIDTLQYNYTGFNNILNNRVVRYYNSNFNLFDGYNTFALKFVLLSNNSNIIPRIKQIRALAVSA